MMPGLFFSVSADLAAVTTVVSLILLSSCATTAPKSRQQINNESAVVINNRTREVDSHAYGTLALRQSTPEATSVGSSGAHETKRYSPASGAQLARGKEVIRRVIRRNSSEIRDCYQSALAAKPDLSGKVLVRFTIGSSGEVIQATTIQGSTIQNNEPVIKCILSSVKAWKFPSPARNHNTVVTYPFILNPKMALGRLDKKGVAD